MRHIALVTHEHLPADARSAVAEMAGVFPGPTPDPINLHALYPPAMIAYWHMSKAVYFSGHYRREYKDIIASGVSAANGCRYCSEAHGDLVALNFRDTGRGIRKDDAALMTDPERQALYRWSRATASADGAAPEAPPFSADDRAEVVGVALMFHYTNRIVNVMLGDSPLPLPRIPGVKPLVMMTARGVLRKLASQTVERPGAVEGALSDAFAWARQDPIIHSSFCAFDRTADAAGATALEIAARQRVADSIQEWRGHPMPFDRGWVERAVADLAGVDRAAARLSLLVALDSRRVTKADVLAYRSRERTDADLVQLLIWSSFQATKRIGTWL